MVITGFSGKTAISTGAASGMGLLFAETFAKEGGNVVMCDINREVLEEKAAEINSKDGGRAIAVVCDVRDYAQICAARDKAIETFGRIDILCNFAGGTAVRMLNAPRVEFPEVPLEIYDWGLEVNLRAPLYFAHAVAPQMREQKSGLIINLGSITGMEGDPYGIDYPTAKAGLMHGLTQSLAQYGAAYNIRCVCVSPGPVLTRPSQANMATLVGRAAEPKEIVDLIMFIASDQGQFINGTNIMIDGGRSAAQREVLRNPMGRWK